MTIGATGTQWGKSQAGSLWMKRQIHTFTEKTDNFILMAPTYKIMQQSMLPYFLNYMRGMGHYNKGESIFEIGNGGIVYFRTETDPDSVVGIPRTRAYWLDEAGKVSLYFWENVQARAASVGALGLLTTSPYSRNWLYRNFIKPNLAGGLPQVSLIQAPSWENPYHTLSNVENRRRMREMMDPRRFDMLFGGEWGQMVGLVYDCFDESENICDEFRLPEKTKYYAGVDWGFNPDPFVVKVRAITPDGNHYDISEFYKTGMTLSDMVLYAKQVKRTFPGVRFLADPSQPGSIEEFNRNGIPTEGADNDINRGVGLHYELIKTRAYKIFRGSCPYTLDEIETYHYPEPQDLGPDDNAKEQKPVGQNDHCMDVDRYITITTYRTRIKSSSQLSQDETDRSESQRQRLARLMRPKSLRGNRTENWS